MTPLVKRRLEVALVVDVSVVPDDALVIQSGHSRELRAAQMELLDLILADSEATRFFIRQAAVLPLVRWLRNPKLTGAEWLREESWFLSSATVRLRPEYQAVILAAGGRPGPGRFDYIYSSFLPEFIELKVAGPG